METKLYAATIPVIVFDELNPIKYMKVTYCFLINVYIRN